MQMVCDKGIIYLLKLIAWKDSSIGTNIANVQGKMISNDQELMQSDPTSCPQNQRGNN